MRPLGQLRLVGPAGEPVDLWRTIASNGIVELPPMRVDDVARTLEVTLPIDARRPRTVLVSQGTDGDAEVAVSGRTPGQREAAALLERVRWILRLDADLSPFYAIAARDPDLAWVTGGAGRIIRAPTVFEDVVKTICTTNCAWSATERMVSALVGHLGEASTGAAPTGPYGRAFPTPAAMAAADDDFYRNVVRAGYRGRYLRELAAAVAGGTIELEELGRALPEDVSDDEIEARLLSLPGVGPYAAAHVMLMLGRYSRLVLDSWTRPKYARVVGRRTKDATIVRRFRRYRQFAGLAFWLTVTRDWVDE